MENTNDSIDLIALGGIEDVTKNLYVYEYKDEILIVDCGIGFADETMLGVDLLLPDINYLQTTKKKIVGMVLSHGHEDHIGALPFVLPQLPKFPIYASPLTAAMSNDKLKSFAGESSVKAIQFGQDYFNVGSFKIKLIHVTHSIPDAAHIVIKTPAGIIYHGSDYKFDQTPYDNKLSDIEGIKKVGSEGVLALVSDCLGATRKGRSGSDGIITPAFENILSQNGRVIITTYSSNINRLNQIIDISRKTNRKVALFGRSLLRVKRLAQELKYLQDFDDIEIRPEKVNSYGSDKLTLIVAGSQAQESSALMRMTNGEHRDVSLKETDIVVFSSDIIPGNEIVVYSMVDELLKKVSKVYYKDLSDDLHVSGHGSQEELVDLVKYLNPKNIIPISGMYHQMASYKDLMTVNNIDKSNVFLISNGQRLVISNKKSFVKDKIKIKNIYVDEFSQEEVDQYILHDRERLSKDGMVIIIIQVESDTGKINGLPDVITRGINLSKSEKQMKKLSERINQSLSDRISGKHEIVYVRKTTEHVTRRIIRDLTGADPLVLAVVIEI